MVIFKVDKAKGMFFDRPAVLKAVSKGKVKALSQIGAFVRRDAKSSIRTRKAVSKPWNPPSSHTGVLKKYIFFGYDKKTETVVVGPVRVNQIGFTEAKRVARAGPPDILENGGPFNVFEVMYPSGEWVRADLRSRNRIAKMPQRFRAVTIRPRPYMKPALDRTRKSEKLIQAFKDIM